MLNLEWISNKYFPSLAPHKINRGHCYNWAFAAYMNYNDVQLFTIDNKYGHAFVRIGNLYYDAENICGVKNWRELSSIRHYDPNDKPIQQTVRQFLFFWYDNGKNPVIRI